MTPVFSNLSATDAGAVTAKLDEVGTKYELGEGGTTVYALPATPVVLLSVNNRTVSAELREER